ncbi:MAG: HD domain-containing protein [Bacillota bacterium]
MDSKAAVIYIGSSAIYMNIAERSGDSAVKLLEEVEYPLNLGQDTFTKSKIGFEKVKETCQTLLRFKQLIKDYQVHRIRVIATTAIREAKNRDYILDQIKIKTNLQVEVLDDSEEKRFIYRGILRNLDQQHQFRENKGIISYIGTGRLGVALYSQGNIKSNQNIRIGSLKLSEILGEIQEETNKFYIVVEEYLSSFTYMLSRFMPTEKAEYFIATGKEIELIANLCQTDHQGNFNLISKEKFFELYDKIKDKTPNQVSKMYNLPLDKAEILLPSMALYKTIFNFTIAENIIAPFVSILDVVLFEMLYPKEVAEDEEDFYQNIIYSARSIGQKYNYDAKHAQQVERFALEIFDQIKEIHGLSKKERNLLQVSAILHDVGKFISLKRHYYNSYNLIRSSNILGFANREIEIIANIARYHSRKLPQDEDHAYQRLSSQDQVLMSKLLSMLRLADALDRGHQSKFNNLAVKLTTDKLTITIITNEVTALEEWTFKQKSKLFEEVFGLKTEFKKKERW